MEKKIKIKTKLDHFTSKSGRLPHLSIKSTPKLENETYKHK